jgi:hypothetical protein
VHGRWASRVAGTYPDGRTTGRPLCRPAIGRRAPGGARECTARSGHEPQMAYAMALPCAVLLCTTAVQPVAEAGKLLTMWAAELLT